MTTSKALLGSSNVFSTENIIEAFLATTDDGFIILDPSLKIVHFNSAYQQFHKSYTGKFITIGASFVNASLINSREQILLSSIEQVLNGESVKLNAECTSTKNKLTFFDIDIRPIHGTSAISGITIKVIEAKEQRLISEDLSKSEELFKTLIQNSTDAFLLADSDFSLTFVSGNIENVLGYCSSELLGKSCVQVVHPDDLERLKDWMSTVLKSDDKLLSIEYRAKNKDGNYIWLEKFARNRLAHPGINAIVINVRNIQGKKLADSALIQSESRLSLLLNNTEESFIILNSRLRVTAYNRAAQEHAPHFFQGELQSGISILELVSPEEMDETIALFEKVFEGAQVEKETTSTCAGNQLHIYSHIFRPLIDSQKEISGVFITSTDITKRKIAEEQVKESEIRFKTIIQESFDAVIITDAEGNIVYTSPSITNVLGYSSEDLIGRNGFDYIHEDFKRAAQQKFQELLESPNIERNIDVKMRHKNSDDHWIEVKGKNMFHNKYVKGMLISLRNITDRKNAEELISLSEQRFKGLVQSGADIISILDEGYIVQYSSPTVRSIIGIDPEQHKGKSILENVHPEDLQYVKEKIDALWISHRSQIYIGPYRYKNFDGKYFWLEFTITNLLGDPSIKGIVLNSRDITERKKLTEDLAANTDRLKTAQRIAKLGYFEYDFIRSNYFFSDEFYEVLDLKDEKLDNWNFEEVEKLIHPEDKKRVKVEVEKAIKLARDFTSEMRLIMKSGKLKVISAIGVAVKSKTGVFEKLSVTLQDITDTRMAMLAFETMEGRFKSLFENSIDGVLITLPSGEILSANPALCKMVGYVEEELLGTKTDKLFDGASAAVQEMITQKAKAGMFVGEILLLHKNEYYFPVDISVNKMKDAEGNIYYSNIIRNITEKKKIEEEQKSLTQELVKNNQDLQQFSFITSHNLRAPVANLLSLLSLYDKDNPAEEFNKLLIDKFEEATQQLNSTLNDLINVLVIKSNTNVEKERLLFSDIYENVKRNLENLIYENGGSIQADFSEEDEIIYNKIHLESIFLNLISNAIRYRSPDRSPVINIKSYRQDKWVVVNFADNGLGIDLKRYGDRIFGLYQRFHQNNEGKGLGLYMVNSQVIAMGGKIEVESEPGLGSTFKIYFKS